MCLYPQIIKNPKYKANKKNGGNVPVPIDKRAMYTPIGCGECMECRKQKSRDIQVRLLEDIRHNKNGIFIALTFTNEDYATLHAKMKRRTKLEAYDLDNQIAKYAVRKFLERWRKKYKKSVRHWLITELGHGDTEHIHMHGLLWVEPELYVRETKTETIKDLQKEMILDRWQYGDVWVGDYVNERTINYCSKYITKVDAEHKYYKPIILTSPGIGAGYVQREDAKKNKYKGKDTREYYVSRNGYKLALPIYWRNKIYSEDEREKLWMQKLDEEKRYVNKREIDISKSEQPYWDALQFARYENKLLGYGSGEIDWNRKRYEKQRRMLKQKQRIDAARVKEEESQSAITWGGASGGQINPHEHEVGK